MTDARVTQAGVEVAFATDPDARITQAGVDVVLDTDPAARITQAAADVVYDTGPAARVTQAGVDVVYDTDPAARVTQAALDVVWAPRILRTPPTADLSGVGYADLLLHTLDVIDIAGDQLIDTATDTIVKQYWT